MFLRQGKKMWTGFIWLRSYFEHGNVLRVPWNIENFFRIWESTKISKWTPLRAVHLLVMRPDFSIFVACYVVRNMKLQRLRDVSAE
jgi:hypothetical protein